VESFLFMTVLPKPKDIEFLLRRQHSIQFDCHSNEQNRGKQATDAAHGKEDFYTGREHSGSIIS